MRRDPDITNVDFSILTRLPSRASTESDLVLNAIAGRGAFTDVPRPTLDAALAKGYLDVFELERDQLLPIDDENHLFFVCKGQVALGVFQQQAIDERRRRQEELENKDKEDLSLLPLQPLARAAQKNVARFGAGDVFNAAAVANARDKNLAFFSLTPTTILRFEKETLGAMTAKFNSLAAALGDSVQQSERLFRSITGVKQEIFDFYLRHGLSVSGPIVRVRQLDLCIDCKQCESACAKRHAARRITLGGFRLGMLDFVFSCRTCQDQRCLSPCEHDSISFNEEKGEVVIDHAKCIGCSLCAQSCPYGAIDMVNVSEPQEETFNLDLKARLEAKGYLAHGPGKPRSAPLRRVANKCDHCDGFQEQACVSACPTGALVELNMRELFRARSDELPNGRMDKLAPMPVEPFVNSAGIKDSGLARIREGRFSRAIWGLGILVWLLFLVEVAARHYAPTSSLRYQLLLFDGLDPKLARLEIGYLAGSNMALLCGYLGTALMVISMAYPLRRRMRFFMKTASNKYWLDLHLMTGTIGPLFIVLHSAMRLDNWVSVPFGSMLMVVGSGFLGRYLYTLVPSMIYGHEVEELDLRGQLAEIGAREPRVEATIEAALRKDQGRIHGTKQRVGLLALLVWLIVDEVVRIFRTRSRRRRIRRLTDAKTARQIARLTDRIMFIGRRAALAPRARLFLKAWKHIHVPFSIVMLVTSVVHIVVAWRYSM